MSAWWAGREPRERILLLILAVIIGVFILIFGVLGPVRSGADRAEAALNRAQLERAAVARIAPSAAGTKAPRQTFSRSVLISAARGRDVKLTRVQPGADGSLQVWIDDAMTASLYGLMDDLLTGYRVDLDRAVISADATGRLSAQFTLKPVG